MTCYTFYFPQIDSQQPCVQDWLVYYMSLSSGVIITYMLGGNAETLRSHMEIVLMAMSMMRKQSSEYMNLKKIARREGRTLKRTLSQCVIHFVNMIRRKWTDRRIKRGCTWLGTLFSNTRTNVPFYLEGKLDLEYFTIKQPAVHSPIHIVVVIIVRQLEKK